MSDNDLYVLIGKMAHSIGLLSTSIVILTLLTFSIVNINLINKLTIRIMIPLVLSDVILHLSEILGLGSERLLMTLDCELIAGLRYFGRLLYCLTNIGMCFNLYRSIVLLKRPKLKLEVINWLIIILVIIITMVIFGFLGSFSGMNNKKSCRPGSNNKLYFQIEEGLVGVLAILTLLICLLVYFTSRSQFNKSILIWAKFNIRDEEEKEKFIKKRRKMLERSFLYPLATIITLPSTIALSIMDISGVYYNGIFIALSLTQGSSGILTFLAFSLDPAVWEGIKYIYSKSNNNDNSISNSTDNICINSEN